MPTNDQRLAAAFADPNSLDDQKLGNSFVEANSSRKKHKKATGTTRPQKRPVNKRILLFFILAVVLVFLIVFFVGFLPRHSRDKEIDARLRTRRRPFRPYRCFK